MHYHRAIPCRIAAEYTERSVADIAHHLSRLRKWIAQTLPRKFPCTPESVGGFIDITNLQRYGIAFIKKIATKSYGAIVVYPRVYLHLICCAINK